MMTWLTKAMFLDGWMGGQVEVEAVLKIAYSNQKAENVCSWMGGWRDVKSRFKDCLQLSKTLELVQM